MRDGREQTIDVTLGDAADRQAAGRGRRAGRARGRPQRSAELGLTLRAGHGRQGVVVTEVDPDGPAAEKGLKPGDVILEVGGRAVPRPPT